MNLLAKAIFPATILLLQGCYAAAEEVPHALKQSDCPTSCCPINLSARSILMILFSTTNGSELFNNGSRNSAEACDYEGVVCEKNVVVDIDLSYRGLKGSIPSELGQLGTLVKLFLLGNELTGTIPSELGQMGSLGWLHLRYNQLTGPIPSELGELGSLIRLKILGGNDLTGSIPDQICELEIDSDLECSLRG